MAAEKSIKYMTLAQWIKHPEKHTTEPGSGFTVDASHVLEVLIDEEISMSREPSLFNAGGPQTFKPTRSAAGTIAPSWSKIRAIQLLINSKELIANLKTMVPRFNWEGTTRTGRLLLVRPYKLLVLYEEEIRKRHQQLQILWPEKTVPPLLTPSPPPLPPPPFLDSGTSVEQPFPSEQQNDRGSSSATDPGSTQDIILQNRPDDERSMAVSEGLLEGVENTHSNPAPGVNSDADSGSISPVSEPLSLDFDVDVELRKSSTSIPKPPLHFKDAVGRKFSFPWHLCKTWAGMEELIKQAFLHVDVIGPHVMEGHYDLIGPGNQIILPQLWESIVKPDWNVSMQMWPMPEATDTVGAGKDSRTALQHFDLLVKFMDEDMEDLFELRRKIHEGTLDKIAFDDLWHLFEYGQEVFIKDKVDPGNVKACRVHQFAGGRGNRGSPFALEKAGRLISDALGPGSWGHAFGVQCWSLTFEEDLYWPLEEIVGIRPYEGEVEITSLAVYPSKFSNDTHLKTHLTEQGRLYREFASRISSHRRYLGRNLDGNARGEQVDSEVIIDFKEALAANPTWACTVFNFEFDKITYDMRELMVEYPEHGTCEPKGWCIRETIGPDFAIDVEMVESFTRDNKQMLQPRETIQDADLTLLPDKVFGYVLNRKSWAILSTAKDCLQEVHVTSDPWNDLVLEKGIKDTVEALVAQHLHQPSDDTEIDAPFQLGDFIAGKGRSLVVLLHGPPGVGKTSTAECIAAHMNKPLYPLTSGNLPVKPNQLEDRLQSHFTLAERWGCILLLDEADVFLQRRRLNELDINAMVSVFLRQLEYYKGILFLTTNRVGDIDPAFKSRIHVSLEYEPLDRRRTKKIYELHLRRIEEALELKKSKWGRGFTIREDEIMEWAKKHFKSAEKRHRQWNGRQIHNAFQTAVALAEWDSRTSAARDGSSATPHELVLGKKHFKRVAEVSEGFDQYMTDLTGGRDESELAASNWQRYDFRPAKGKGSKKSSKKKESSDSDEIESSHSENSDDEKPKSRKKKTKDASDESSDGSDDSDSSAQGKRHGKEKGKQRKSGKSKKKGKSSSEESD